MKKIIKDPDITAILTFQSTNANFSHSYAGLTMKHIPAKLPPDLTIFWKNVPICVNYRVSFHFLSAVRQPSDDKPRYLKILQNQTSQKITRAIDIKKKCVFVIFLVYVAGLAATNLSATYIIISVNGDMFHGQTCKRMWKN